MAALKIAWIPKEAADGGLRTSKTDQRLTIPPSQGSKEHMQVEASHRSLDNFKLLHLID